MRHVLSVLGALSTVIVGTTPGLARADEAPVLTGRAAVGDWRADAPGVRRLIRPEDLPPPYATRVVANVAHQGDVPAGFEPKVLPGFRVAPFAKGLDGPRLIRVAPNGDVFVAETSAGQIRVLRPTASGERAEAPATFATGLDGPFGIAFYPPGQKPEWVYVATNNQVLRFRYAVGDTKAQGDPETIVSEIAQTSGGHTTRDVRFSPDGKRMFVSVGSGSNIADEMPETPDGKMDGRPLGAAWGGETDRADVLAFKPDGTDRHVFATGIRNCVSLAVHPATSDLWCATNERDLLGDDLVPDYVTRVGEGRFYGWPWFYIGDHEDPRKKGQRPDLAGKITVPDVLLQSHSAPLQMTFYDPKGPNAAAFPAEYAGDAFVALHGSWNRQKRTGYKVVRARLHDGVPTGEYEDFMTGFVGDDDRVWGRPVGVAVARDGSLLVSEDDNGMIWRIAYVGKRAEN